MKKIHKLDLILLVGLALIAIVSALIVYAAKETTSARGFNRTVAEHEPHPIRFDSHER